VDGSRFDDLARLFSSVSSRRRLLRTLASGTLTGAAARLRAGGADAAPDPGNCTPDGNVCHAGVPCCGDPCCGGHCCTSNQECCQGKCRNSSFFQHDHNNCGACGVKCPTGASCVDGNCVCRGRRTLCNNRCVPNVQFVLDSLNCGSCGHRCAEGQFCCGGTCVSAVDCAENQYLDLLTCTCQCATVRRSDICCPYGQVCRPDTGCCSPLGGSCGIGGEQCCSGYCRDGVCACVPSGGRCSENFDCCTGVCLDGKCVAPTQGTACTSDTDCGPASHCGTGGQCVACQPIDCHTGLDGSPLTCPPGMSCVRCGHQYTQHQVHDLGYCCIPGENCVDACSPGLACPQYSISTSCYVP
jgi:hypothetical protein